MLAMGTAAPYAAMRTGSTGHEGKMADVDRGNRPLSPHLTIYRPQLNSITSILTRITGNALIVAVFLIVWWMIAAATSLEYFNMVNAVVTHWLADLVMAASVWALWYHLLSGVRHLVWDSGHLLETKWTSALGWGLLGGATILTLATILLI